MRSFRTKIREVGFVFYFLLFAISVFADPVFLIGEDAMGPDGMAICVNSFNRSPGASGLGMKGKQELVEISFSMVNSGKDPVEVRPMKDFLLILRNEYLPTTQSGKFSLEKPFTLHPNTDSRGVILFRVPEDDTVDFPIFRMTRGRIPVSICCDPGLGRQLEQGASGNLDLERSIKLIQFLVANERMVEAEKVISFHLGRHPDHPVLLLQMAAIHRWNGKHQAANEIIGRLAESDQLPKDEAVNLAVKAFEQGQLEVSKKILEPIGAKGQLDDSELILLARCWYFERQFEQAEDLLKQLYERGLTDRSIVFTLGNIADKRDDWTNAVKFWKKTLEIEPNHFEAQFNIGVAYYKMGNNTEAKEAWAKVLGMNPDSETKKLVEDALKSIR